MDKYTKKKIRLTTKQILLFLGDILMAGQWVFDPHRNYSKEISEYWREREVDKINFSKSIYRLKKQKFIESYKKRKKIYLKLTQRGKNRLLRYSLQKLEPKKNKNWDGKWRLVIFDISEKHRPARDQVRSLLRRLGFYPLQKSVFVYPFDVKKEIDYLKGVYNLERYIIYAEVDLLDTDINLVDYFYDQKFLTDRSLNLKKKDK